MIQRIESQGFLFILDTEIEWDGVGYPTQARKVWQCRLDDAQELPLYEAKYLELKAEWDAQELAREWIKAQYSAATPVALPVMLEAVKNNLPLPETNSQGEPT